MALSPLSVAIERHEYDAFAALLKDDPEFPASYDEWMASALSEDERRVTQGRPVVHVVVHARQFADWCRRAAQRPNVDMLRAFAISERYSSTGRSRA